MLFSEWYKKQCIHKNWQSNTQINRGAICAKELKFSHGNMAYAMIMLFINIELFMVDINLSKGFPGQLHEALCKCIGMILA